jgi:hypothetical protein
MKGQELISPVQLHKHRNFDLRKSKIISPRKIFPKPQKKRKQQKFPKIEPSKNIQQSPI